MARAYFLDSSALLKRYLRETGTPYVLALHQDPTDLLYIAQIAGVEIVSAITRQTLGKNISKRKAQSAITQFRHDFEQSYVVLGVTDVLIQRAMGLAETHALRAYDAVQLATALIVAQYLTNVALIFVCADEQLNRVARVEGLVVENPNDYR